MSEDVRLSDEERLMLLRLLYRELIKRDVWPETPQSVAALAKKLEGTDKQVFIREAT